MCGMFSNPGVCFTDYHPLFCYCSYKLILMKAVQLVIRFKWMSLSPCRKSWVKVKIRILSEMLKRYKICTIEYHNNNSYMITLYIYVIEICLKLDKSNTQLRFRCVIFCSGFISFSKTSSRLRLFSEFFYLKTCEKSRGGIVVAEKVGRDLKSNV